jgi:carboxyl-terminal processing protease
MIVIMKKHLINLLAAIFFLSLAKPLQAQTATEDYRQNNEKLSTILQLMKFAYVDTIKLEKYTEKAIVEMLKELDPHSTYISKEEVQRTNEPLVGNFEGVGVQFQIIKDTIVVAAVINGGPSEKVGIMAGDKFLKVDTAIATGKHINNKWVFDRLRGTKGTEVNLSILRRGQANPLEFRIIRDKIPINSIDVYFMVEPEIGYIKLDRFAQTTMEEFSVALNDLKIKGMKHLILDLRGNSGGFLNVAIQLSDEFLNKNKLIVYTEGANAPTQRSSSTDKGSFKKGRLLVLIDEGSASASEIVSGAVQDWDRGLIMGRRSFGKGLVQKPYNLNDGSIVRFTTSRYHTPTGRSIQKPYDDGVDEYYKDLARRRDHRELVSADSIKFPDSLQYKTPAGRIVYGGGGIMPDIFVPIDTNRTSPFYSRLARAGLFNQFTMEMLGEKREELKKQYPNFEDFRNNFKVDKNMMSEFIDFAAKEGVVDSLEFNFAAEMKHFLEENKDSINKLYTSVDLVNPQKIQEHIGVMFAKHVETQVNEYMKARENFETEKYISYQIRTLLARNLYGISSGLQIWFEVDEMFNQAVETVKDEKLFKKMKIQHN